MDRKKDRLIGIVGRRNVLDDTETLEAYSRDESFVPPMKPWFVVKPKNVQEVQKVVVWANETRTPLVPVSSGPPRFRGDTIPAAPGAAIVDLTRMNKIIRINRRNRMALVEPGVTYSQLQPELAKSGLRLTTPLLPRRSKSVIASLLEREPTLVPKYNSALPEPLRCLEIVWGNGETLRTGDSAVYPSLEEQWEKGLSQVTPTGPGQTDYHRLVSGAQGSMGIVTWASLKCEVLPKVHRFLFIPAAKLEDLIECAYRLLRVRLGDEFLLLNNSNLASMLRKKAGEIRALKEDLPPWVIVIGIAGRDLLPEEKVNFQEKDIRDVAQQSGLKVVSAIPGASARETMRAVLNPSGEPYWKLRFKGACQDIFFLTTLDKTPGFVDTICSVADTLRYPISDIGIYIQPQHQGTACHCEFSLPFNRGERAEAVKAKELFTQGSEVLIKQDAYFSRPYGIWADMTYNRDANSTSMLKTVKGIFDPNDVLNPGKLCF